MVVSKKQVFSGLNLYFRISKLFDRLLIPSGVEKKIEAKGLGIERKTPQHRKVTKQDLKLARHLQKTRKKSGLTQEQLADKIRKSVTWIGYIESGYRIPNLKLLYKIAKALGVRVKDLFSF